MSQATIKWGILGTSKISGVMARAIQDAENSQLLAIGSRSKEGAQAFAATYGIPKHYDNHEAILSDPEIDAVYIGLPNHLHKDWIVRCAQAGKHILCEKPLVTNIAEAREMFTVVANAKVYCMEALMYRCHPLIQTLYETIESKVIGEIKHFNAFYSANIAELANPVAGGAIMNLGCYPVSLIRLLAGTDPVEIAALGRVNDMARDHHAMMLMRFENNMMATVGTADDMEMVSTFEIYGSKGYIRFLTNPWMPTNDNNHYQIYLYDGVHPEDVIVKADKALYTYQIDVVNKGIRAGKKQSQLISWQDSLGNVVVLDAWLQQVQARAAASHAQHKGGCHSEHKSACHSKQSGGCHSGQNDVCHSERSEESCS